MKKTLFALALMFVVSISIQAQSLQVASVGKFISEETAQRWMQNFKDKFPNVNASHAIDKSMLTIMLTDSHTQGIYFYNALNTDGATSIIPMACNHERALTASLSSATEKFQAAFPERAKAQLVGRNILSSLLELEGAAAILIANAIDDDGQERLVYIALNSSQQWMSDTGDGSMPCPPYCPKPGPLSAIAMSME